MWEKEKSIVDNLRRDCWTTGGDSETLTLSINIIIDISTAHRRIFSFLSYQTSATRVPQTERIYAFITNNNPESSKQSDSSSCVCLSSRKENNNRTFDLSIVIPPNTLLHVTRSRNYSRFPRLYNIDRIIKFIALPYAITITIVSTTDKDRYTFGSR